MSGIYNIGHCVMTFFFFELLAAVKYLSFSIDTAPVYFMKKKQGGPIPMGLKR